MVSSIVILTGAGMSAESGIATFRDADGLWENHRPEDVATPEAFEADPVLVHRFYNDRRRQLLNGVVAPNAGHVALARLEREFDGDVLLVTQNIDDLHERAGSTRVLHMHGELLRSRCVFCDSVHEFRGDVDDTTLCPGCGAVGGMRPHVVWFGEIPLGMEQIFEALESCDVFAAIGTSGNVYPAAGFVQVARAAGAHTVELNLEPSWVNTDFEETRLGPAGTAVPEWVEEMLNR
ncbi:Sir2 family NAD+-dependent deacetylase [Tessaracoccus antarcticus]|uniref:NAD-dependent protein deacylase n=1 Tax=Tessaracoccus antarcticus TaxID=2479848 RepID=A0A3M0GBS4_9ACTN|nr:Sir2 family NAD+-dependent deacetylase [Tessaracoccus antarcticus]RMB62344.1 NAD-dependent protein deacylase [Tessaracoccus antarcticus]